MAQPKVYVTRRVPTEGLELLKKSCKVSVWDSDDVVPKATLMEQVAGMDGLFCTISDIIDKDVLEAAGPSLKIIGTMSVGMAHIDARECAKRGVQVANTPDVASDSAAELTVALLLLTTRRLAEGIQAVKTGEWGLWRPMWLCGVESVNRTLGIIGMGRVGFGVARRMKPFGVSRIIYYDEFQAGYAADVGAELVDYDTLLRESDIICICCALTPRTRDMINASAFASMKKSAILINTARGPIVNHDDLAQALTQGDIAAAGLDVTEPEPLPSDHPLMALDNCIILPHLGTNSKETRINMATNTAMNITAVLCCGQA
ncbi:glyoxylate reductase/hydroxypyruvate reductase-like [Haliotis cracherodii]|uniref:glyoxylate reductase/hydroxypyruvate reductase-like n=1 Tax=Haliotis cracherodii TaxID=6455 RepID=UPI0039EC7A0C